MEQEIWSFLKSQLCFMPFLKNIKWKFPYIKELIFCIIYAVFDLKILSLKINFYVAHFKFYTFFLSKMYFMSSCNLEWEKKIKICESDVQHLQHMTHENEFVLYIYIRMITLRRYKLQLWFPKYFIFTDNISWNQKLLNLSLKVMF